MLLRGAATVSRSRRIAGWALLVLIWLAAVPIIWMIDTSSIVPLVYLLAGPPNISSWWIFTSSVAFAIVSLGFALAVLIPWSIVTVVLWWWIVHFAGFLPDNAMEAIARENWRALKKGRT